MSRCPPHRIDELTARVALQAHLYAWILVFLLLVLALPARASDASADRFRRDFYPLDRGWIVDVVRVAPQPNI